MARSSDAFFLFRIFKDKTFQAQEVKRVVYMSTLYLVITTGLLAIFYQQMIGQLIAGQSPLLFVAEDVALLNEQIPAMSAVLGKWIMVMLVINVIVTSIIGVYILRKLGHPIMAIKRALRDIGEGKLDTKLRSSDSQEFEEITQAFNAALEQIQYKIAQAKGELSQLDKEKTDTKKVSEALANCNQALDFFQVDAHSAKS